MSADPISPVAPLIRTFICSSAPHGSGRTRATIQTRPHAHLLARPAHLQADRVRGGDRRSGLALRAPSGGTVRSLDPALPPLVLRTVLCGEARPPGQSADGSGEVLYLRGDHEELAGRTLRHLGKRPEVEEAE